MQQGNRHRASPLGEGPTRFEMQIEDELKEEAAKAAAADNRSLAGLIVFARLSGQQDQAEIEVFRPIFAVFCLWQRTADRWPLRALGAGCWRGVAGVGAESRNVNSLCLFALFCHLPAQFSPS
jgi:hypothetical protein